MKGDNSRGECDEEVRHGFLLTFRESPALGQAVHGVEQGVQDVRVVVSIAKVLAVAHQQGQHWRTQVAVQGQSHVTLRRHGLKTKN